MKIRLTKLNRKDLHDYCEKHGLTAEHVINAALQVFFEIQRAITRRKEKNQLKEFGIGDDYTSVGRQNNYLRQYKAGTKCVTCGHFVDQHHEGPAGMYDICDGCWRGSKLYRPHVFTPVKDRT